MTTVPSSETVIVSLTGPASHTLVRESGVGSVTIGPVERDGRRPDLVVGVDDTIDWSVFDPFTVPAGYPWPRWFSYHGNDTGFLEWATTREIEAFDWRPAAALTVDGSRARISRLRLRLDSEPLEIVLPHSRDPYGDLDVTGDPGLLRPELAAGSDCPDLTFYPDTRPVRDADPLPLPPFPTLAAARAVTVTVEPLRQAFDCASLLQFPDLRRVGLDGRLTNLDSLARLRALTSLRLRYCPDLAGLPDLETWPNLTHVFASNVEQAAGKRLRTEIRRLAKAGRTWEHTSVSQLRGSDWFRTEYGLPFSAWSTKAARAAVKAYRSAEADIAMATAPSEVEAAVRGFVRAINALPDIETTEREEAGEAVARLASATPLGRMTEQAQTWFDNERDF
jgi:hypothetical protein